MELIKGLAAEEYDPGEHLKLTELNMISSLNGQELRIKNRESLPTVPIFHPISFTKITPPSILRASVKLCDLRIAPMAILRLIIRSREWLRISRFICKRSDLATIGVE